MTDYFKHNIKLLEATNPLAAKALNECPDAGIVIKQIQNQKDLYCVYENGQEQPYYNIQSVQDSVIEIKNTPFNNPRVLIFLGFGLGQHILEYLKNPHLLTKQIIIIEPFLPVVKKAFETADFEPLFKAKAQFIVQSNPQNIAKAIGQIFSESTTLCFANAVEYFVLKDAQKLTPNLFKEIPGITAQAIAHQFNRQFGDPFDAYLGTANFLANLPKLLKMNPIDKAKNIFMGKPGIVVASGPSLTETIPYLKQVASNAVLAACPSALPAILQEDIEASIWLNIERLENQGDFLKKLPQKEHVFVGAPLVHPKCFDHHDGINSYILGSTLQSQWLKSPYPAVDLGHSSAHTAFLILQKLGCNPIYLVGQDLCYENGSSHAEGTWDESAKAMQNIETNSQKTFKVMGNSGKEVSVNLFWHTYLKTFEEKIIPEYDGIVYHVIDTNKGAKINGTKQIEPHELINHLKNTFEVLKPLKECLSKEIKEPWQDSILPRLNNVKGMLMRLAQDSEHLAIECKKFQFNDKLLTGSADIIKPIYETFMKTVMSHSSRYRTNPVLATQKEDYELFFHGIVQGLFLRYRIEYFGKPGEEKYDSKELKRKAEILFHMSKDEAFWANAIYDLINCNQSV